MEPFLVIVLRSVFGFATVLIGVFIIVRFSSKRDINTVNISPQNGTGDAAYIVNQLSRNYEVLRSQTNLGFLLSAWFMAIGLAVICVSLFAPSLGLQTQGVGNLGILAGIITEFISASALVLYGWNFRRLNATSDRLDNSWKVLAAYKLTAELPDTQKAQATMMLINTLAGAPLTPTPRASA